MISRSNGQFGCSSVLGADRVLCVVADQTRDRVAAKQSWGTCSRSRAAVHCWFGANTRVGRISVDNRLPSPQCVASTGPPMVFICTDVLALKLRVSHHNCSTSLRTARAHPVFGTLASSCRGIARSMTRTVHIGTIVPFTGIAGSPSLTRTSCSLKIAETISSANSVRILRAIRQEFLKHQLGYISSLGRRHEISDEREASGGDF